MRKPDKKYWKIQFDENLCVIGTGRAQICRQKLSTTLNFKLLAFKCLDGFSHVTLIVNLLYDSLRVTKSNPSWKKSGSGKLPVNVDLPILQSWFLFYRSPFFVQRQLILQHVETIPEKCSPPSSRCSSRDSSPPRPKSIAASEPLTPRKPSVEKVEMPSSKETLIARSPEHIPQPRSHSITHSSSQESESLPPPPYPDFASPPTYSEISEPTPPSQSAAATPPLSALRHWGPPRVVKLEREPNRSLGISIVGGKVEISNSTGAETTITGIFIKQVLPESPAGREGNLLSEADFFAILDFFCEQSKKAFCLWYRSPFPPSDWLKNNLNAKHNKEFAVGMHYGNYGFFLLYFVRYFLMFFPLSSPVGQLKGHLW